MDSSPWGCKESDMTERLTLTVWKLELVFPSREIAGIPAGETWE